jgi:hypothetical protein
MNEGQSKYFENMVIRNKEFEKKNQFQKDFWKWSLILTLQKSTTTIWLRFWKMISHLILLLYFKGIFSHYKKFGVEFNMNSSIY